MQRLIATFLLANFATAIMALPTRADINRPTLNQKANRSEQIIPGGGEDTKRMVKM